MKRETKRDLIKLELSPEVKANFKSEAAQERMSMLKYFLKIWAHYKKSRNNQG